MRCEALKVVCVLLLFFGACSSRDSKYTALADTLAATCPASGQRGSVLVTRVAPEEEESGVISRILGDGVGPGVVLCRGVLYADARALLDLMGETATVTSAGGRAIIDGSPAEFAYRHDGVLYVAVAPFARHRRALLVPSTDHPMDVTIWPRATLLHMKASGMTSGAAYQAAMREGLLRD